MRRTILVVIAALAALAVGACGDDSGGSGTGADGDGAAGRVEDVAELAAMLDGVADGCALEYEGLVDDQRAVSICTLGGESAELSVWEDLQALEELNASAEESGDPVVTGPNWSVDVTDAALAAEIAEATGGSVHP